VAEACTGCGVCQFVCPAPHNAVLLMPVPERPVPSARKADDVRPT
jgi:ferredoxin-type protein NapG